MKTILIVFFLGATVSFGQVEFKKNLNINRISHCHLQLFEGHADLLDNNQLAVADTSIDPNTISIVKRFGSLFPQIEFSIEPTPDVMTFSRSSISGEERKVIIYTSLINTKLIGLEAKAMIVAHQIAHHYGGKDPDHLHWSSNESHADLNAITRILPKIWRNQELGDAMIKGCHQLKKVIMLAEHHSAWELFNNDSIGAQAIELASAEIMSIFLETQEILTNQG